MPIPQVKSEWSANQKMRSEINEYGIGGRGIGGGYVLFEKQLVQVVKEKQQKSTQEEPMDAKIQLQQLLQVFQRADSKMIDMYWPDIHNLHPYNDHKYFL